MSYISVKEAIQGILSKSMDADEAFVRVAPEQRQDFQDSLAYIKESLAKAKKDGKEKLKTHQNGQWSLNKEEELSKPPVSEAQRKAMWAAAKGHSNLGIPKSVGKEFADADAGGKLPMHKEEKEYKQVKVQMDSDTYEPQGKHQPVMESPKNLKKAWTNDAQWSLNKAIKPGPTLDYSQFNKKPDYADIEAKAPTINYSKSPGVKPAWSGATDKAKETRARIDAEAHETAAETIARRQGKKPVAKNEGTNLDAPPADKGRMTAKNEMMGYGPTGSPENAMAMSEHEVEKGSGPGIGAAPMMMSENDEGSPEHEAKEKEKAKKIKDDAEYILDMHKGEHIGFDKLSGELQRKGHSKESSDAIAASIGRKKYGAHKMAEMAHKSEDPARSSKSVSDMSKEEVQKAGVGLAGSFVSLGGGKKRNVPSGAVGEQAVRDE